MIQLNSGNVLLKPSHRKQLRAHLRRAIRLGQRVGNFAIAVSLRRNGRMFEMTAHVTDRAGSFNCRSRRHAWKDAVRDLADAVIGWVHGQRLAPASA